MEKDSCHLSDLADLFRKTDVDVSEYKKTKIAFCQKNFDSSQSRQIDICCHLSDISPGSF